MVGEGLDTLAGADSPVTLDLKAVSLGKLFESLSKASGVEFLVDEELAGRPITIQMNRSPLKLALKHVGLVAGVKYEVVGNRTVQVRPVLLAGADGVTLPVLIQESKIQPEYPAEAREARIEGRVILQARIGREGNVGDMQVLDSQHGFPALPPSVLQLLQGDGGSPAVAAMASAIENGFRRLN